VQRAIATIRVELEKGTCSARTGPRKIEWKQLAKRTKEKGEALQRRFKHVNLYKDKRKKIQAR